MTQRPSTRLTEEQSWCGVWWDCTDAHQRCTYSELLPSVSLRSAWAKAKGGTDA